MRIMPRVRSYAGLHIFQIHVRPLIRCPPDPGLPRGITLRVIRPEELFKATNDPELEISPDFVRAALARGDMAFGAFDGDSLVAYTWRTFTAAPQNGLWVKVSRPYRYGYKSLTRPSYRGKRLHAAVSLFSDAYFLDEGYTHDAGYNAIENFSSQAMRKYLGTTLIGYAGYLKWRGHYIQFRTPSVKRIGFEFFEACERQSTQS